MERNNKKGFTLLEVVVVLGVLVLVLPALFGIVFAVMKQQIKVYKLTEVKRQGDAILNLIQKSYRPAYGIYDSYSPATGFGREICKTSGFISSSSGADMYFKNAQGDMFRIYMALDSSSNANVIFYDYSNPSTQTIVSNPLKVRISSYNISCERASVYGSAMLTIDYVVAYTPDNSQSERIPYRTRIVVRNYK
jgi:prepilin-type N-terminal cleavage/methylation domain-containing protein